MTAYKSCISLAVLCILARLGLILKALTSAKNPRVLATLAEMSHLFPFRTQQLSSLAPMVLVS
jgi:hypothetical protein